MVKKMDVTMVEMRVGTLDGGMVELMENLLVYLKVKKMVVWLVS